MHHKRGTTRGHNMPQPPTRVPTFNALLAPFLSSPAAAAVRLTPTFVFCGVGTWDRTGFAIRLYSAYSNLLLNALAGRVCALTAPSTLLSSHPTPRQAAVRVAAVADLATPLTFAFTQ